MSEAASPSKLPGLEYEPDDIYVLKELNQVRALATPLRVRILDCLGTAPRTVTEIGRLLNVNPTNLYYHVNQLEQAGLIMLVHAEVQSGIQHKYFRGRARYYSLPPQLLTDGVEEADVSASFFASHLENAAHELRRSVRKGVGNPDAKEFQISRREARMTLDDVDKLREKLDEIDRFIQESNSDDGELEMEVVYAMFPRALKS